MDIRTEALLLAAVTLAVSACATTQSERDIALDKTTMTLALMDKAKAEGEVDLTDDQQIVCRKEFPTGSHIAKFRCDTKANAEQEERMNQQRMRERIDRPKPRIGG